MYVGIRLKQTYLNPHETKRLDELSEAIGQPGRRCLHLLATFDRRTERAVGDEDSMNRSLCQHGEPVEQDSQLRILPTLSVPGFKLVLNMVHPYAVKEHVSKPSGREGL